MPLGGARFWTTVACCAAVAAAVVAGALWRHRRAPEPAAATAYAFPGWDVNATPGALLFKKSLDAGTPHRLRVRGRVRAEHAPASVRVRLDGGTATEYPLAPQGTDALDLILPRATRVEILLSRSSESAFDLQDLSVVPCAHCLTDAELKPAIAEEARIRESDSPFELARKLRNWVADAVVLGGTPAGVTEVTGAIVALPVSQTYSEIFKPTRGAVSCAGFAVFYQKVLRLFGLPSFTIDVGWDNGTQLTHVTTVVVLGGPEHRRFYIFDPTFSGEYVHGSEAVEAVDLLKGRTAVFKTAPMSRRLLIPNGSLPIFLKINDAARSRAVCDRESPLPDMTECRGFMDTPTYNALSVEKAMAENGVPRDADFIVGLMRHKILGVLVSDLDPGAHQEFLRRAEEIGVPIPKYYHDEIRSSPR